MNEKLKENNLIKYDIIDNNDSIIDLDENLIHNENYFWSKDHLIDFEEIINEDFTSKNKDFILLKLFYILDSYLKIKELQDSSLKILISYINSYNILRIKYLELKCRIKKIEFENEEKNQELLKYYMLINNINQEMTNIKTNEFDMINLKVKNYNIDYLNYNKNNYSCKKNFCVNNDDFIENHYLESKYNELLIEKQNMIEKIYLLSLNIKEKDELLELINIELAEKNKLLKQKENELNKLKELNKSSLRKNHFECQDLLAFRKLIPKNYQIETFYFFYKNNKFLNNKISINPVLKDSNNYLLLNEKNNLDYFLGDLSFNENNEKKEIKINITQNHFKINSNNFEIFSESFFIFSQKIKCLNKTNSKEHFKEAKSIYNKFFNIRKI